MHQDWIFHAWDSANPDPLRIENRDMRHPAIPAGTDSAVEVKETRQKPMRTTGTEHDHDLLRDQCRFGQRLYIGLKRFELVRLGLAGKEYMRLPRQNPEVVFHHLGAVLYIVGGRAQSKVT